LLEIWYNANRHRDGRYLAENRTYRPAPNRLLPQFGAGHAHKPLFGNQGKLLNLGHLDFDIVSTARCPAENLELRISYFASLGIFTLVKSPLQINPFYAKQTQFARG